MDLVTLTKLCEREVKALPISHYLGYKIDVRFSTTNRTSYFQPEEQSIVVALSNIVDILNNTQNFNPTEIEIERIARNFLYHEISHAILTPKDLMIFVVNDWQSIDYIVKNTHDNPNDTGNDAIVNNSLANILEDERIETLLKHFYKLVDFKANVKTMCGNQTIKPQNFEQFVFKCVRLRQCNKRINDAIEAFICEAKDVDYGCSPFWVVSPMEKLLVVLKQEWEALQQQKQNQQSQQNATQQEQQKQDADNQQDNAENQEGDSQEGSDNNEDAEGDSQQESDSQDGNADSQDAEGEDDDTNDTESESQDAEHTESEEQDTDNTESEEQDTDNTESEEQENTESESQNSNSTNDTESENTESGNEEQDAEEPDFSNANSGNEYSEKDIDHLQQRIANSLNCRCDNYKGSISAVSLVVKTQANLQKVLAKHFGFGIQEENTTYGYSGSFKAGRFMTDFADECKWFEKSSLDEDMGNIGRKNEKRILNIWLDNSTSFEEHDKKVNELLRALVEIEKNFNSFEFRLVTWGRHYTQKFGDERVSFSSQGCTVIFEDEQKTLYKKLNSTGKEYNIFLTDGKVNFVVGTSAQTLSRSAAVLSTPKDCLGCFNNNRTIMITYAGNGKVFKECCPKAEVVLIKNNEYSAKLAEAVSKSLDKLM